MLKVTIYEYLDKLATDQKDSLCKEPHRAVCRHIPTSAQIAAASGFSLPHYYKWAGNKTANINRKMTCAVITYLRLLGFDTQLVDILRCDDE